MSEWKAERRGRWMFVESKPEEQKAATKEDQRKQRDDRLAELRFQRETFWMPQEASPDEIAKRFGSSSPEAAAAEFYEVMQREVTLRNAQAWLYERLRCAIHERNALEAALAEERKDREVAENQRRLSDQALSERCKQLDEARRQLRDRGVKKAKK